MHMLIVEFEENHVAKSFIGLNELRNEDKQFGLMTVALKMSSVDVFIYYSYILAQTSSLSK